MEDIKKPSVATPEQASAPTPRESLGGSKAEIKRSFSVASAPSMELPKGGGAIRGMGETFKVNAATGTGSFGVPLPITPSPRGLGPELGLSYDSGSGNSPFGLGWSVGVPSITRKTDKKIPEYLDNEDSDLFMLSGSEDLVPWLDGLDGDPITSGPVVVGTATTTIDRFRPRIEGGFSIIERVTVIDTNPLATQRRTVHWRAITRDNVRSTFGSTAESRICDPNFTHKVYSWLLDRTEDDRGNVVLYEYKPENTGNTPFAKPSETHHQGAQPAAPVGANRYLKRVRYGNTEMESTDVDDFMFELVFDYGEHGADDAEGEPGADAWDCRPDPYSSFRAGFEIRTYRRCKRVLMFHHFEELAHESPLSSPTPRLVRALELGYDADEDAAKRFSRLADVTVRGYDHDGTAYSSKAMPKVSFGYTPDTLSGSIRDLTKAELGDDYPQTAIGSTAEWVDLDQEGLPGLLIEQGGVHRYKRNIGGVLQGAATLQSVPAIASRPAQLMDIAGAGTLSMVLKQGNESGYAERTKTGWAEFKPFKTFPNVDMNDPNLRFLDLNGDGFEDILITRGDHLVWYPSLGRDGYGHAHRIDTPSDEERGPRVVFADTTSAVFVADMNGDGMADIVRVTHGGVAYWPNMGHGRFGAMVRMDTAPLLATTQFHFDARRVRLADLDGTGAADLCFFHEDNTFKVYRNQSGNGFGAAESFYLPSESQFTGQFVDFYGTGTSAYVFYLRSHPTFLAKVWDPLQHQKPNLLNEVDNHMGKIVRMQYAASTKFYVEDRLAGRPWVTKLPFPVHVVERSESYDAIRKARFVSTYKFHHGHYDTYEREFRGFGMVEQWDTEFFGPDNGKGLFPEFEIVNENGEDEMRQDPILTKTWFHTGAWQERAAQGAQYLKEYWSGDTALEEVPHLACDIPTSLPAAELREAARALRGTTMRSEVYELDGSEKEGIPLAVRESCYSVKRVQARKKSSHPKRPDMPGVFQTLDKETRSWAYDRIADDPRTSQTLVLAYDPDYGMVTRSAAIAYPRREPDPEADPPLPPPENPPEQKAHYVVVSESVIAHVDGGWDTSRRLGIPCEAQTWELTGTAVPEDYAFFTAATIDDAFSGAGELSYDEIPTPPDPPEDPPPIEKRLVQHECAQYYSNALVVLDQGSVDSRALLYRSYLLDLTPGLLTKVYNDGADNDKADATELGLLLEEGSYVTRDGSEWIDSEDASAEAGHWLPSGHAILDAGNFFLPIMMVDPFGNETEITYETDYNMFATSVEDALENVVSVTYDFRTLSPKEVTDPNGNRQQAAFDELGMIKAMAVMGKTSEPTLGDTLEDPTVEYAYDYEQWESAQKPNWVKVKARETHGTIPTPKFQESKVFSDGSGGVVMTKVQAAPNDDPYTGDPRWIGSGRTVINNKGNPIKQYEPYFSDNFDFEDEDEIVATGVTAVITYDGLGRVERTDLPNGSYSRVHRTPWLERAFDPNDTVGEPGNKWAAARDPDSVPTPDPLPTAAEERALALALLHADTPTETHLDSLGRAFLVIAKNNIGANEEAKTLRTRTIMDVEGQVLEVKDPYDTVDPLGRTCQTNVYSMAGKLLKESNIDKGARWYFQDVTGALLRKWDARGQRFRLEFDELRRATHLFCKQGVASETLLQRTVFGDSAGTGIADPTVNNLRGKPIRAFDGAGVVRSEDYDFKGNRLSSERQLVLYYTTTPDWSGTTLYSDIDDIETAAVSELDTSETFTESRAYDALGRVVEATTPDMSVYTPTYNEAGLLEAVEVSVRGGLSVPFVDNITYDAKGQRSSITYSTGNFSTQYDYDEFTFRLTRVLTERVSPSQVQQDLRYTFDPVGNILEVTDDAHEDIFYADDVVSATNQYEYDATYRLIYGSGREHNSVGLGITDNTGQPIRALPHPNDPATVRTYEETYEYDKVGNILELFHDAGIGANTWTREYEYEDILDNNQLTTHTGIGSFDYEYDEHGSMVVMPHLSGGITWSPFDQMKSASNSTQTTHFTYGADGSRVRKVYVDPGMSITKERIYLGSYEIYRERTSGTIDLERHTLHVMDGTKRIAMVETKTVGPGTSADMFRYQLGNHLGSATLEVDEDGLVISYEEYSPYGASAFRSSRSGVEVSAKRYRYVGLECDDETGLYHMGARYYAAWLGRWTSADPMGIGADGPGLYNYTRGSPVVFIDPGGMKEELSVAEQAQVWLVVAQTNAAIEKAVAKAEGRAGAGNSAKGSFGQTERDISGANAVLGTAGVVGSLVSSLLPDSAKEAIGGASRKQSERTLAPVAMAELLFVPPSNAQEAEAKSDALIAMGPGMAYPGLAVGDSMNKNLEAAQDGDTVGAQAHGAYGFAMDLVDVGSMFFGGVKTGGPKGANPKPAAAALPPGSPYRQPGTGGTGGGGPTGGASGGSPPSQPIQLPAFSESFVDDIVAQLKAGESKGTESVGKQALKKKRGHAERGGFVSAFNGLAETTEQAVAAARGILEGPSQVFFESTFLEAYEAGGRGVRIKHTTGKFMGFAEIYLRKKP